MMEELNICFKCGVSGTEKKLIHHHLSAKDYTKEGDGKLVLCCCSCHKKIHLKIRKENRCPLSVEDTNKLSSQSERRRYNKKYHKTKMISYETLMPNVRLFEKVQVNIETGTITVSSCFSASNGKKIKYINIEE